eukprot:scaffold167268_cov19-Tisochrysis_lutea.AAC.3
MKWCALLFKAYDTPGVTLGVRMLESKLMLRDLCFLLTALSFNLCFTVKLLTLASFNEDTLVPRAFHSFYDSCDHL